MEIWDGWPDFGAPIAGGPSPIFAAYGGSPIARAFPDSLTVASNRDGAPDFELDLLRAAIPSPTSASQGMLRFRIATTCQLEQCLAAVRVVAPRSTVASAAAIGGYARLVSAGTAVLGSDLGAVRYADWGNLETAQLVVPDLTAASVSLVKDALLASTLLIWARLELDIAGVATRVPVKATFSPKQLLSPILPATRRVAWADLVAGLSRGATTLPLQLSGDASDPVKLGAALAERIRMAWGQLAPSNDGATATIEFPESTPWPDSVMWDLSTVIESRRPVTLQLDPLMAPRALAAQGGIARLVVERTGANVPTGVFEVSVWANLPERREAVAAIGVVLRAPAVPPARRQDVVKTVELDGNRGSTEIRLGAKESLAYTATPYVVLAVGGSVTRLEGASMSHDRSLLELGPDDFPVTFLPVSATPALLADASITAAFAIREATGAASTITVVLSAAQPATSVPLPAGTTATWTITATPIAGGAPVVLGPLPATPLALAPTSFPGYGAHTITVAVDFAQAASQIVAIDLVSDEQVDSSAAVTTISFTPDAPTATWKYFARSAFRAGYRYRVFRSNGDPAPWSEVLPADQPLNLEGDGMSAQHQTSDPPPAAGSFVLEGVRFYPDPASPAILRYLPAVPIPARGPDGTPLMSLIAMGAAGSSLQLSVQFDLEDDQRDRLRAQIAANVPALASALLQPASLQVTQVSVRLVVTPGAAPVVLGTSSGSGFPPWDAIFSIKLAVDQAARAKAALAGEAGILSVTVSVTPSPELTASLPGRPSAIEFTADVATWVAAR